MVHRLGETVIGEGVKVRAGGEEVGKGPLGILHQCKGVIIEVAKLRIGVNLLVLVLARIQVLIHYILVLEVVHGSLHKGSGKGKMRWHAYFLHVEPFILEPLSDPA